MTATNMTQNAQVDQDRFKRCERLQKMGRTAMITRWNTPYAAWIVLLFFVVGSCDVSAAEPSTGDKLILRRLSPILTGC